MGARRVDQHTRKMGQIAGQGGKKIWISKEGWEMGWFPRSLALGLTLLT